MENFNALDAAGESPACGALLLAQTSRERVFEWLREQVSVGRWSIAVVPAEPQCLWLRIARGELLIVCGSQVVAEPGLEVLVLGTARRIEDGLGIERTLQSAQAAGALPVLPWGFGKWTGRRETPHPRNDHFTRFDGTMGWRQRRTAATASEATIA